MIKVILIIFAVLLLFIGWYVKQNITKLEVLFSTENHQNLIGFSSSYLILGVLGLLLGIFLATQTAALFFVAIVLIISGFFSVQLAKKMK
ncbi:hypothetical protein [Vagococcus hydrophili]|uniref:DUF3784 domain-containing protein n=1 Tax=Vagococcus hydrophili TaxID=2714947 RepID=A0A6G8ARS7_9ENTE|nr:hypothetical protein [Vagococcus hydrophili]QIL47697.1 hypothetical protein G7082_03665 [Vagococcus hydrophili]